MLIISSWSEQFRSDIGFNGVSQVWNDRLSWYFWLADAPGVYLLEMMDPEEGTAEIENRITAVFKIKCYPYQEHPEFQSFSFFEKQLVQSTSFDHTNTPAFEHQGDIPDDLFSVATIEMAIDTEGHGALFSFESMTYLRTRFANKTRQTFPMINLSRNFGRREIDRNVPGFQMGYPLFDCLVCLYANAHKRTPDSIRFSASTGVEFIIHDNHVHARETDNIKGFKLDLFFAAMDFGSSSVGKHVLGGVSEEREHIIYDRQFACGDFHEDAAEKKLPMTLNRKWWSLAHTHYDSELASSCGCH
jgi:hypothetical protein